MIYWYAGAMVAEVRRLIEKGTLSAAEQAESGTALFCQIQDRYQRIDFDTLNPQVQALFLHKTVGAQVLEGKIVGIFHIWPVERITTKQPIAC